MVNKPTRHRQIRFLLPVDFNLALDTGQLDEAAKIRNDMVASEEEWTLEDTDKKLERQHEKRMDQMDAEIEKIEEVKARRLKALDEEEERQRKHLDKMHENQQKALDRRQEAAQKALQQEVDNNIKGQEAIWENRKENVDKAIRLFLAYVPKNEADLRRHIGRISEKYGIFNTNQETKFGRTSKKIGSMLAEETMIAAESIRSDIRWARIGNDVAREMMYGALGMTPSEFKEWMTSGIWPAGAGTPTGKDLKNRAKNSPKGAKETKLYGDTWQFSSHTGGWAGQKTVAIGRKGVARTSGLMPNEYGTILRDGEYVVNADAAKHHAGLLENINSGNLGPNEGGAGPGFAGLFGGILRSMMASTVQRGIMVNHQRKSDEAAAAAAAAASGIGSVAGGTSYGLPGVKPWVLEAANYLGNMFGIQTIYGVGSRPNPSDHPLGLALDFMTSSFSKGDALAAKAIAMGKMLDITYLIWKQRINSLDGNGWRPMEDRGSPTANHMDHVHVSFSKNGKVDGLMKAATGTGITPGPGGRFRPISYPISRGLHDTSTRFPGVDMAAPTGTPVRAVANGRVSASYDLTGYEPRAPHGGLGYRSYGRVITVDHGGFSTLYAHLSQRLARQGQSVPGGTIIGKSGNTGYSTGPHLHFGASGASAAALASLSKGAANINVPGLYNLHQDEAVLTKDLNAKFHQGVENFANGGNSEYNINVNVTNPNAGADDIAKTVLRTLQWNENRRPKGRRG